MATAAKKSEPQFKVKKQVTLPLLKFTIDKPVYVKITAPIFLGKEIKGQGDAAKMEPAHIANCVNLETGEECQIIVATVLRGIFEDNYDEDKYVNCGFMITKLAKKDGKRYNPYTVAELEL